MTSRRRFLQASSIAAGLPLVGVSVLHAAEAGSGEILHPTTAPSLPAKDPWRGLRVGMASYSFRKLPLDATIAAIKRVDLHYVSIKDAHLPMNSTPEQRKAVAQQFKDAGITPVSCGVITIKNEEASVRLAFEYARDIGATVIVCHPEPEALSIADKFVKEFDIKLALHNHGPEAKYFKSPYDSWKAVQDHDERIGLCMDVGHTARAGVDPVEAIGKCKSRLYDMHMKDVWSSGVKNASQAEVEVGRGTLDVKGMFQALLEIKYACHVGFEHEKNAENPLPGVAESVGYCKGIVSCIPPA